MASGSQSAGLILAQFAYRPCGRKIGNGAELYNFIEKVTSAKAEKHLNREAGFED